MEYCWNEEDVVTRLLQQSGDEGEVGVEIKSLYDELLEVGECVEIVGLKGSKKDEDCDHIKRNVDIENAVKQDLSDSSGFVDVLSQNQKGFELKSFMQEFMKVSKVMDKQIDLTNKRAVVAEEQKKERKLQEHKEKELLREAEEKNLLQRKSMQEEYERKIKSLKQALDRQKDVNKELQLEFNKVLDEKEQEIENLMIQVSCNNILLETLYMFIIYTANTSLSQTKR